jgi:hypothetical protein
LDFEVSVDRIILIEELSRGLVVDSLVRPLEVILVLPELEIVLALLGRAEAEAIEEFLLVSTVGPFNKAVSPGFALRNQSMKASRALDGFGKSGFTLSMRGVFHSKVHGVVGPDPEKGGSASRALWKTRAIFSVVACEWICEYLNRVAR